MNSKERKGYMCEEVEVEGSISLYSMTDGQQFKQDRKGDRSS
jgi:hypothetical protein